MVASKQRVHIHLAKWCARPGTWVEHHTPMGFGAHDVRCTMYDQQLCNSPLAASTNRRTAPPRASSRRSARSVTHRPVIVGGLDATYSPASVILVKNATVSKRLIPLCSILVYGVLNRRPSAYGLQRRTMDR